MNPRSEGARGDPHADPHDTPLDGELGRWLFEQHAARRPYASLRDRIDSIDQAYRVQQAYLARVIAARADAVPHPDGSAASAPADPAYQAYVRALSTDASGEVAGYKIGLTTPRMQAMCKVSEPIAGVVLAARVALPGTTIRLSEHGRLGIESEICVALGSDLPANCTRQHVQNSLRSVHAAFELIDDRHADYAGLDAWSMIADNSWNAGIVVGEPGSPDLDLSALSGTLSVNGAVTDRGSSADAMGHPLDVVVWLARLLGRQGRRLRAGQLIMTGSLVTTKFAEAGQHYAFEIGGLPPVSVTIAS